MKTLTRKQLESRKVQAVRFTRDVLGDDDRADEIEEEPIEDYAERRRIRMVNQKGTRNMPATSKRELLDRIDELESENEDLQSRLDEISDIVGNEEYEDEGSEESDDQGEE